MPHIQVAKTEISQIILDVERKWKMESQTKRFEI
jgi:hypothetical protein